MPTAWNMFVKKIFQEGRKQYGKAYKFSQALKDASKRKSEMGKNMVANVINKVKKVTRRRKGLKKNKTMRKDKSKTLKRTNKSKKTKKSKKLNP